MFELFIARRYLQAKRKQVVISVVTLISVIGVVVGVMALVIAVAIENGFRHTLERDLLSATAPVSVLAKEGPPPAFQNTLDSTHQSNQMLHASFAEGQVGQTASSLLRPTEERACAKCES